jgi:hypothetical protein
MTCLCGDPFVTDYESGYMFAPEGTNFHATYCGSSYCLAVYRYLYDNGLEHKGDPSWTWDVLFRAKRVRKALRARRERFEAAAKSATQ